MPETENKPKYRKPRKILVIKPSKYEFSGAVHSNREYWNGHFKDPKKHSDKPLDSEILLKTLPPKLYDQVCRLLQFPPIEPEETPTKTKKQSPPRVLVKEPLLMERKQIRIERDCESDTDVEIGSESDSEKMIAPPTNVHLNLLRKPEREQITWNSQYLQPEEEHEKNLVKKADDLTDKIAQEFCSYMQELGGNQQSQLFTPAAIKELFQIEFDTHVARGLQVVPKELPVVEDNLAAITGHSELSKYAVLERLITQDIKAENTTPVIHAFGRTVDLQDQWIPPKNDTKSIWLSARHVPKDLITLKTVWEGITNLKSVKEYCRWMIEHPEHEHPLYLKSLGMFDPAVLRAKLTVDEGRHSSRAHQRRTNTHTQ